MPKVKYETRQEIIAQALREIQFARTYKQAKTGNWKINEDLYYGRKSKSEDSRANVDLGRMGEFLHTLLSKIDNPLSFKFTKKKNSQLKRVKRLNSLRVADQDANDWDIKDLAGKKQAGMYGRAIYSYFAQSEGGYKANLDNVDVYDFLIDPAAGGLDIEKAKYLGDYGVVLSRQDIEAGVKAGLFLRTEAKTLLEGSGNATTQTQETTNQRNRQSATGVATTDREISDKDKFKFWRWGTTYGGKRYYLLLTEAQGTAIRVDPIEDVFESGLWWYWTWAAFLDLTEFWTPSYCDYVRDIFMAQASSINQALDNGEQVNKPQKVVDVGAVENLAELKYQKGGNYIKSKSGFDASKAVQILAVPSIDTPFKVFDKLEAIQEKASGVNATSKGVSDEDKVGIYEGNQANTADRFGLLNKSYAFGYKRFARLWEAGVREHLTKPVAVDIIGPDGIETEDVSRRQIFRKNERFGIAVEASNAETALSEMEKRTKIAFLNAEVNNQNINAKKAFEIKAGIAGFNEDEIRQLLDTSEFGDAELMSEADRDIERILDNETIPPNPSATTAYKQRFVDWLTDHEEDIKPEVAQKFFLYIDSLDEIIIANMTKQMNAQAFKMKLAAIGQTPTPSDNPNTPARAPALGDAALETAPAGEDLGLPPTPEAVTEDINAAGLPPA